MVNAITDFLAETIDGAIITKEQMIYHPVNPTRHVKKDFTVVLPGTEQKMVCDVRICNVACVSHQGTRPDTLLTPDSDEGNTRNTRSRNTRQ